MEGRGGEKRKGLWIGEKRKGLGMGHTNNEKVEVIKLIGVIKAQLKAIIEENLVEFQAPIREAVGLHDGDHTANAAIERLQVASVK